MTNIRSYAAKKAGGQLEQYDYDPGQLGGWEIDVDVSHCGICHSDVHLIDNDWDISAYPLVPGHEIVGTVAMKGKHVDVLKRGDRVGIGWQSGACFSCDYCLTGRENLCTHQKATCVDQYGGFADRIHVDSRFAFKIPESLDSVTTAPLLCGGITVYSPLRLYGVIPPMRVGVIGIGGLGHMALQFARAFGCEVTAFSSHSDKKDEAKQFGAHKFVSSTDSKALNTVKNSLDFIITTVFVDLDWEKYLRILKPGGKLCVVGSPPQPIPAVGHQLIVFEQGVVGSNTGGRYMIREMLDFAARHNIKARTEPMPMSDANKGINRVRDNDARYRVVLQK